MTHHAYFYAGNTQQGVAAVRSFIEQELGIHNSKGGDIHILSYGLFSVDDARKVHEVAYRTPGEGNQTAILISATRIFHEAQNALLKIFEEPPAGVTLFLIVPSEGMMLPTLRSRLLPLPAQVESKMYSRSAIFSEFLAADEKGRTKVIASLIERAKADKDDEKQSARAEAVQLVEGLISEAYIQREQESSPTKKTDYTAFLADLQIFLPLLHTRSAPLKLIFEHVLLVIPTTLTLPKV